MKSDRRAFLASLGAAGALAACSARTLVPNFGGNGAASTADNLWNPLAGKLLPFQIFNRTGYADSDIWFYVVGNLTPDMPGKRYPNYHLVNAKTGALARNAPKDVVNGYADYSINLANGTTKGAMMLPSMDGGCRMYFSIKSKLKITLGSDAYHVAGSPDGWSPSSVNYKTIFDFMEFVNLPANPITGFNGNLSQVDFTGIPMMLSVFGSDVPGGSETSGFRAGARTKMFNAIKANAAFKNLVIPGAGGDLRALAPNFGVTFKRLSATYLDPYINQIWTYFKTHKLTTAGAAEGVVYVGTVGADGRFAFTSKGRPTIYFKKPTTEAVFRLDFPPTCTGGACPVQANELRGAFPAAINRGILLQQGQGDLLPIGTATRACTEAVKNQFKAPLCNFYGKAIVDNAINGKAYWGGTADVCSQSSLVVSRKPTRAVITLVPF